MTHEERERFLKIEYAVEKLLANKGKKNAILEDFNWVNQQLKKKLLEEDLKGVDRV